MRAHLSWPSVETTFDTSATERELGLITSVSNKADKSVPILVKVKVGVVGKAAGAKHFPASIRSRDRVPSILVSGVLVDSIIEVEHVKRDWVAWSVS